MRCIVFSSEDGATECVYFTEDKKLNPKTIIPDDCTLDYDFELDDEFPSGFPTDYILTRA